MTDDGHSLTLASGILVPDPDQGTPYISVQFAMPSTQLMLWEPFEDGLPGGHNLLRFAQRWREWESSDEPFLESIDLRFGHPVFLPRAALSYAVELSIGYHRKEDARAGHRSGGLSVAGGAAMRQRQDGSIEIRVPR